MYLLFQPVVELDNVLHHNIGPLHVEYDFSGILLLVEVKHIKEIECQC